VITADDFGLAKEVNEAVELAHQQGVLSAASLMVAGPAAADALAIARRNPGLRVGLHLVLVDGAPMSPPELIPNLLDLRGRLRDGMARQGIALALRPELTRQSRREIAAQFRAYQRTGLPLDHVNAHRHFHLHPVVAHQVLAVGREFGVSALRVPYEPHTYGLTPWNTLLRMYARRAGLVTPDAVFGLRWSGHMTADRLGTILRGLPAGLVEIYTHPATSDSFAGHAPGYRYCDELAALCDPDVIAAVRRSGRTPGGYADVSRAEAA
jgi:hopanoid biosynthesis associated protein HpnK